jgi:hypothetical protein
MKRIHWFLLFLSLSLSLAGQRNSDYGVFAGISSYIGDINPNKILYSPKPVGGLFFRYNLHPRQALRASLFVGGLTANDIDFNNDFQQARKSKFSGSVVETALQFEFNFFPYTTAGKLWDYTPYFAVGAGIAFINTEAYTNISVLGAGDTFVNASTFTYIPVIPFSFGFKVNIHKNVGLEAEYGFRKTFYDNFDGLKDPVDPSDYGWIHNNDWYSFAGVAVTWKIFSNLVGCPAYNDVDSRRKR